MSTKILSGSFKGQKIITPQEHIRPSKAIIRKSLMDQIRFNVEGGSFLDLFAGSGAMGIEAISNQAKTATFVEIAENSIESLDKNIEKFSLYDCTTVLNMDAMHAVQYFFSESKEFDFIFADPPYNQDLDRSILKTIDQKMILQKEGHFFLETNQILDHQCKNLKFVEKRKFGKSYLYHFQR